MKKLRVAVLMGGISSERDVSLRSGEQVANGLNPEKYEVMTLDFTGDVRPIIALQGRVDVVFPALHGPGGEDGRIQGLLDLLEIPYIGSGVLGSAMAMHKGVAKAIYREAGIPTPRGILLRANEANSTLKSHASRVCEEVGIPCVVKPANEGSSIGISLVKCEAELGDALADAFCYDTELVVEQFIAGVEISVPVVGAAELTPLPPVEIIPQSGFYDYEMKYTPGATEEICPARISDAALAAANDCAVRAHQALQCHGMSRTDMIVTGDTVTVIETNTLPGMTQTSLIPLSAHVAGIPFPALLDLLIADALGRVPA